MKRADFAFLEIVGMVLAFAVILLIVGLSLHFTDAGGYGKSIILFTAFWISFFHLVCRFWSMGRQRRGWTMRPIFEAALTALLAKRFRSFPCSFTTLTELYHAAPVPHNFASQILRAILFAARLLSSTMHLIWTTSSRVRLAKLLEVSQQKFMVRIVYMVCVCVRVCVCACA